MSEEELTKELAKKVGVNPKLYSKKIAQYKRLLLSDYNPPGSEYIQRYFLSGERGKKDWPREYKKELKEETLKEMLSAKEKFVRFELWVPYKKVYTSWWKILLMEKDSIKINNGIVIGFTDWLNSWGSNYEDFEVTTGIEFWSDDDMKNCRVTHLICTVALDKKNK